MCERDLNPVCGSDGRTYASACALRRTRCLEGRDELEMVNNIPCRPKKGEEEAVASKKGGNNAGGGKG